MKKYSSRGFTLVELVLIIAVLGILAVGAIAAINPIEQIRKSNDAKRKTELAQLQRALDIYYQDAGRYPASSADYKLFINGSTINWGNAWTPYISKLPADPSGKLYIYYSPPSSNGQTYYLYANLERGAKDLQACNKGNACSSLSTAGFPAQNACGGVCNYGVSSANVSP